MSLGVSQIQLYVTETGSSWAGVIEKARFCYFYRDFETYLAKRGAWEETAKEKEEREAKAKKHPDSHSKLLSPGNADDQNLVAVDGKMAVDRARPRPRQLYGVGVSAI